MTEQLCDIVVRGLVQLGPKLYRGWGFLTSTWDRQLKFSAYALIYDFMKPLKIWVHLDNVYFHCFIRGTKEIFSISLPKLSIVFFNFSLWSPIWNNENKSCLNELKFWEASENHKSSLCWKFQLSISCGTKKSAKMPQTRAN